MLRTRLLVGTLLAAGTGAVLIADPGPDYPALFVLAIVLGLIATFELRLLIPAPVRPWSWLSLSGVALLLAANWLPGVPFLMIDRSEAIVGILAGLVILAGSCEVLMYRGEVQGTPRIASTVLIFVYLGILPTFLLRMRWFPDDIALTAMAATIFVPKCGDIGAYFIGRFLGKHKFAPTLSPKKTWEGFIGGLLTAAVTAVGLSFAAPLFHHGIIEAIGFGLVVGLAGVFGDLIESMLKRDAQVKDAAGTVPGFGGLLDVIDSVLFAAPVVYAWLNLSARTGSVNLLP